MAQSHKAFLSIQSAHKDDKYLTRYNRYITSPRQFDLFMSDIYTTLREGLLQN